MQEGNHRIPYALFLTGWVYGAHSEEKLEAEGDQIEPAEYREEMENALFCPKCKTPLIRAPKKADLFSNSRTAHFRHKPAFKKIPCDLRSSRGPGLNYSSEEELRRAVQNSELAIINGWRDAPPESTLNERDVDAIFDLTQIVDIDGPSTEVPLGRHTGEKFFLPSKLTTVLALCRNFDKNLSRAFFFPDSQYVMRLTDKLFDISRLAENIPKEPYLYFGRVSSFSRLDRRNKITLASDDGVQVRLYTWPTNDEKKHLDQRAVGRVLVFFGNVYEENGGTPAYKLNKWGAYSLLPEKYEHCLPD
ncbi:hypothetical protein [Achromobacter sp. NCFB-sbj8-Ac1-l]|uniref:hypothetical protein n=1 Tax=unclassified Achromobacter TaxID=2626865 RepID=UPI004046CDE0